MAESRINRKLAAILSADVVGYSKLLAEDDGATVDTLKQYRAAIGHVIERHKGRIVNGSLRHPVPVRLRGTPRTPLSVPRASDQRGPTRLVAGEIPAGTVDSSWAS
jgi:hypothetical protein